VGVALVVTGCAGRPANLPAGFEEFADERFTMLYPNNWTFQPGPDSGVKLSDPSDATYQVTVTVGPVPKPSITSVAQFDRAKFGDQIAKSLIPRTGTTDPGLPQTTVETRKATQRIDQKKRVYYIYEVVIASGGIARHALITATIDKGSLYIVLAGCNDDNWAQRKDKVTTIAQSFQLLPAS